MITGLRRDPSFELCSYQLLNFCRFLKAFDLPDVIALNLRCQEREKSDLTRAFH